MITESDSIFANKVTRQFETGGFLLTERYHLPHSISAKHSHEMPLLGIVYQGSFTEIIGHRFKECVPHSLQFLPAGEYHDYKFNASSVKCLTIEIKLPRLIELERFAKNFEQPFFLQEGLSLPIARLYEEFCSQDIAALLTLEGIIFELLGEIVRFRTRLQSSVAPAWLRQAKDYIHENAREGVSLTAVAALVEVHPTYLARKFRQTYHCSINDYVRKVRISHAVRELLETDKSLTEIAANAGFYDQSHFNRDFRSYLKITPGEFRLQKNKGCNNPKRL